jgi:hypothetical protein
MQTFADHPSRAGWLRAQSQNIRQPGGAQEETLWMTS